jgi:uncharacterized repeat protein (TIGR01451 family)
MGNGRGWSSGTGSRSRMRWVRVAGAGLVLLLMACVVFGLSSRRYAQNASAQVPGSPLATALGRSGAKSKTTPDARSILSHLPLIFEMNQGQANSNVKFIARGSGYSVGLDGTGAVLAMRGEQRSLPGQSKPRKSRPGQSRSGQSVELVRMTLVGANPMAEVSGSDKLRGTSNYFLGNDPKQWRRGIPQFAAVQYKSVYPGIDLVFYGSQGHLEYDFKVAPGASPSQAEMQFDGATKLELRGGDLILRGTGANVRLQAPHIYQSVAGQRQDVEGRFVLRAANRVGFEVGAYDRARELVIDPTVNYSTYFGGTGNETSPSIAVNGDGNIYLAGSTTSTNLLTTFPSPETPSQATLNGAQNIFILKLDQTLGINGVMYLTYLGGSGTDTNAGLGVDTTGTAYVAGTTTSTNFPTVGGYQSTPEAGSTGTSHIFVSALSGLDSLAAAPAAPPALKYSTYLSGSGTDVASSLAIDNNSDVFITGTTTSKDVNTGFPSSSLPAPYQPAPAANSTIQFFVTEVNTKTSGVNSVPYSTYFGGNNGTIAIGGGIAVDTNGNIYFSGTTNFYNSGEGTNGTGGLTAGDFPILDAYQPCLNTPPPVTITYPVNCPAVANPEPWDAFVAKLNPTNATQLIFSTYLGGSNDDSSTALTIDTGAAAIYITGVTNSPNFNIPTGVGEFQPCLNGPLLTTCSTTPNTTNTDAYVAKFTNPTATSGTTATSVGLSYFSYIGGSLDDSGLAIAVDTAAGALVTGTTDSTDFPVVTATGTVPIQSHLAGTQNAFFAHINTTTTSGTSTVGSYATYFGGNGVDRGTSITIDPALNIYFAGDTTSTNFPVRGPLQATLNGTGTGPNSDAFAVQLQTATDLCIRCVAPILSPASGAVSAGSQITMTFTITNEGPDLATNITVSGQLSSNTSATFDSATAQAGTCSAPSGNNLVCTIPTLQSGSTSTVAFAATPTKAGGGSMIATVSNSNNTNLSNTNTASFTATSYSVSISPSSQTVVAGNTATYYVLVNPTGSFGANVSLTCGSLPVGASCGFAPATLTFNGAGSQSSTLNLTTTVRPPITISSVKSRVPPYAVWLMAPGLALLGLGGSKRRTTRLLGFLALSTLFAMIVLIPACSKTKQQPTVSGTPAGSYPLQVTAASGSFTQSAGFSLTVQ